MRKTAFVFILLILGATTAWSDSGLINVKSSHDVAQTADRLEKALTSKGMKIFNRIDHAQGAAGVGVQLRPTELIIFGNPKVGTPLMQCGQSAAIDLPQKALVWEDADGQVWLTYNDPQYLAERHGLNGCDQVLQKVTTALGNFAKAATMP